MEEEVGPSHQRCMCMCLYGSSGSGGMSIDCSGICGGSSTGNQPCARCSPRSHTPTAQPHPHAHLYMQGSGTGSASTLSFTTWGEAPRKNLDEPETMIKVPLKVAWPAE